MDVFLRSTSLLNAKNSSFKSGPDFLPVVFALVTLTAQILHRNLPAFTGTRPATSSPPPSAIPSLTPTPTSPLPPTPTSFDNSALCNFVPATVMISLVFIGLIFAASEPCQPLLQTPFSNIFFVPDDVYIRCKSGNIFTPRSPTRKREPDPPRPPPPSPIREDDEYFTGEESEDESDDEGSDQPEAVDEPSSDEPGDGSEDDIDEEDMDDSQDDNSLGGSPDGEPDDPSGPSNIDDADLPLPDPVIYPCAWEFIAIIVFYVSSVTSISRSAFGRRLGRLARQGPSAAVDSALKWINKAALRIHGQLFRIDSMDSGMGGFGRGSAGAVNILLHELDDLPEFRTRSTGVNIKSLLSSVSRSVFELSSTGVLRAAAGYGALTLLIRGIIVGRVQRVAIATPVQHQLEEEPINVDDEQSSSATLDVLEMFEEEDEFVDAPSHLSGVTMVAEDTAENLKNTIVSVTKDVVAVLVAEVQQTPPPAIVISTSTSSTSIDVFTSTQSTTSSSCVVFASPRPSARDVFACSGTPSFSDAESSNTLRRRDPFVCSGTPSFSGVETSSPFAPRTPIRDTLACAGTPSFSGVESSTPYGPRSTTRSAPIFIFGRDAISSFMGVTTSPLVLRTPILNPNRSKPIRADTPSSKGVDPTFVRCKRQKRGGFDESAEVSDDVSFSVAPEGGHGVGVAEEVYKQHMEVLERCVEEEIDDNDTIAKRSTAAQIVDDGDELDMELENETYGGISFCQWDEEETELKDEPMEEPLEIAASNVSIVADMEEPVAELPDLTPSNSNVDVENEDPILELLDPATTSKDDDDEDQDSFEDEGSTILDPAIIKRGVEEMMRQLREDIATKEAAREAARVEEEARCRDRRESKQAEAAVVKRPKYVTYEMLKEIGIEPTPLQTWHKDRTPPRPQRSQEEEIARTRAILEICWAGDRYTDAELDALALWRMGLGTIDAQFFSKSSS
ncbi:hypothetical protein DXG01_009793 [Tephrocybe rancida]|nr:hypothetical protein DXG01_009793 [Tephrocybe rancida]